MGSCVRSKAMTYLAPAHSSRQELVTWMNSLELDFEKPIEDFDCLLNGEVLCLILNKLFPVELRKRQIERNAVLDFDKKKNFKLISRICSKNNIVQLVDLTRAIKSFYTQNYFKLQLNAEKEKHRLQESREKDEIIRLLSDERDNYSSKLKSIKSELEMLRNINRLKMKPNQKNEKISSTDLVVFS